MRDNPVQFAVVREDPALEAEVMRASGARKVLMVGSGGCTALALQGDFPDASFTLFDINPAQIALVEEKMKALSGGGEAADRGLFNIGDPHPTGLSQCGNFESLFRGMRELIFDLVLPYERMLELFREPGKLKEVDQLIFDSEYWPVVFDLYLSDSILNTMFGPEATQHATPGSYPGYFRELFERGLRRDDAFDNYFLHHVLLGHYLEREAALPSFLVGAPVDFRFEFHLGMLTEVGNVEKHDLVGLSNITDWMAESDIREIVDFLCRTMKSGAQVMYRQLNNDTDLEAMFGDVFEFDSEQGRVLWERDRSLFYSTVHVGTKR